MVSIERSLWVRVRSIMLIGVLLVTGCRRHQESALWPPNVHRVQGSVPPADWMAGCYMVEFDASGPYVHAAKPFVLSRKIASGVEGHQYYEVHEYESGRRYGVWEAISPDSLRVQMPTSLGSVTVTIEHAENGVLKATYYIIGDVGPRPSDRFLARVRKTDCSQAADSNPRGATP